jgi:hypothetical protein
MANRPLTTRDLAGETDAGVSDVPNAAQTASDQNRFGDATNSREAADETGPTEESSRSDRSEIEQRDAPLSEGSDEVAPKRDLEPRSADQSQLESSPAAWSVGGRGPLLPDDQSERFGLRWQEIQTSFVDQPRNSVERADALVADLMQRLAASFSNERERLEAQWDRGDDVSTEDLRVALTRYRSFFDRLLSA